MCELLPPTLAMLHAVRGSTSRTLVVERGCLSPTRFHFAMPRKVILRDDKSWRIAREQEEKHRSQHVPIRFDILVRVEVSWLTTGKYREEHRSQHVTTRSLVPAKAKAIDEELGALLTGATPPLASQRHHEHKPQVPHGVVYLHDMD